MALENVKSFMIRFVEDTSLQEQLKDKTADDVVAAAGKMGFDFTKDELKQFGDKLRELPEGDLGNVSGGSSSDVEYAFDSVANAVAYGIQCGVNGVICVKDKVVDGYDYVAEKAVQGYNTVLGIITGWFH